jgi:signal peptidase II
MTVHPAARIGLAAAAAVILLDQLTKIWILEVVMQPPRVIEVTPFFNLVLVWNRGISFGLMSEWEGMVTWLLPVLAFLIVGALFVWLFRVAHSSVGGLIGLVIGGAIGNLIDRFRFGAVVDFLDVHAMGYHWPAFNVADAAITLGAIGLVLDSLFRPQEQRKSGGEESAKSRP